MSNALNDGAHATKKHFVIARTGQFADLALAAYMKASGIYKGAVHAYLVTEYLDFPLIEIYGITPGAERAITGHIAIADEFLSTLSKTEVARFGETSDIAFSEIQTQYVDSMYRQIAEAVKGVPYEEFLEMPKAKIKMPSGSTWEDALDWLSTKNAFVLAPSL